MYPFQFQLVKRSRKGAKKTYRIGFPETADDQVSQLRSAVLSNARNLLNEIKSNIKWQFDISVVFVKAANPNVVTEKPIFFFTEPVTSTSGDPLELQLKIALRRLWHQIDTFERNGSGWVLDHVVDLNLHIHTYDPLRAGSHIDLSKKLRGHRCLVNIRNKGDDWLVLFCAFSNDSFPYHIARYIGEIVY